jgi:hypothetical protein
MAAPGHGIGWAGADAAMKRYTKQEQRSLAACAADSAARVLPLFEEAFPGDDRPRRAIRACRAWIRTGEFKMSEIRAASLDAHAAARAAVDNEPAALAARAAGQAVATAHVSQHAFGAAYYALKAIAAADPMISEARIRRELARQPGSLPPALRKEFLRRVVIRRDGSRIIVRIQKGQGY